MGPCHGILKHVDSTMGIIMGTNRRDVLVGTDPAGDTIHGLGGADLIVGADAGDTLPEDDGRRLGSDLFGDDGNDTIYAGFDWNDLAGGDGHDRLFGGAGVDALAGGNGNDRLDDGYGGDAYLHGGAGRDRFTLHQQADDLQSPTSATVFDFTRGEDKLRILAPDGHVLRFRELDTNRDRVIDDADEGVVLVAGVDAIGGHYDYMTGPDVPGLFIGDVLIMNVFGEPVTELSRGDFF